MNELLLLVAGLYLLKKRESNGYDFEPKPPPPDITPGDHRGGIIYDPRTDPNAGGGGSPSKGNGGTPQIPL